MTSLDATVEEIVERVARRVLSGASAGGPLCVTVKDAAQLLAISERQVYRLLETGEIPVVRFGKSAARISVGDLETYIDNHRELRWQDDAAGARVRSINAKETNGGSAR